MTNLEDDVRIIRRNLAKGFISGQAVDARLATLPDVADQAEYFDPEADEADAGTEEDA